MAKSILSSDQVHTLNHTFYEPKNTPKATLLIVHGMAEHSGRYSEFAQFLADNDIAVLTYDQLGHGRSISNSDDLGFFNQKHPVQTLLKDVIIMANTLKRHYPDVPHFIMGHSMGSFIVRNVLQVHNHDFAGAILMGTSDANPLIKGLLPIVGALNKVQPKRTNALFAKTMNKILNAKLKEKLPSSMHAWVTRNPEALASYESDPLCGFDFTNNGYFGLLNLMDTGLCKDWAATIEHDFPMLFVSGENDPIGNMGKGIRSLTKRLKKQGFNQVEQCLYPLMRHEPLHEVDNKHVYHDILAWLDNTSAK